MNRAFLNSYTALDEVFRNGAFSGITLNNVLLGSKSSDKALTTKIVYGVLDTNLELEYVISQYAVKVKPSLMTTLKIGVYCLKYLSIPVYAVINDCSELTKMTGKRQLVGFVNATLRNISQALEDNSIKLPKQKNLALSVKYSCPVWAVNKLLKQFGNDGCEQFLAYKPTDLTHVRVNLDKITVESFEKLLINNSIYYENSPLPDAFYIKGKLELPTDLYTNQSLGSMLVARAVDNAEKNTKLLDLCSAPGGKAVYLRQLNKDCSVTACDVYPHRLQLITSYADRLNAEVEVLLNDATQLNESFIDKFDYVLVDAPCSGYGVYASKPDIKLNKTADTVESLSKLQKDIINTACRYVKVGGTLTYSTCTVFNEENCDVTDEFLRDHDNFRYTEIVLPAPFGTVSGKKQFLPQIDKVEGYYLAKLLRTK